MSAEQAGQPDQSSSGPLARGYARAIVFFRFVVPLVWVVAAVAVYHYAPGTSELPTASVDALIPGGMPSQQAEARSARIFGSSLLPRIAVVQRDPDGLSLADQRSIVAHAVALDQGRLTGYPDGSVAAPYVNTVKAFPAARERSTTAITYLAFPANVAITYQRDLASRYAEQVSVPGARAWVTGFITGNLTQSQAIRTHLLLVELVTVGVVAAILGLYLRSLLAPLADARRRRDLLGALDAGGRVPRRPHGAAAAGRDRAGDRGAPARRRHRLLRLLPLRLARADARWRHAQAGRALDDGPVHPDHRDGRAARRARALDAARRLDRVRADARARDGDRRLRQHGRHGDDRPGRDRASSAGRSSGRGCAIPAGGSVSASGRRSCGC